MSDRQSATSAARRVPLGSRTRTDCHVENPAVAPGSRSWRFWCRAAPTRRSRGRTGALRSPRAVRSTRSAHGTDDQRLVGSAYGPSWSADGQHIAYVGPPSAIYTMRADGSGQRRLTHSRLSEGGPGYSPNGKRIVFTRATPKGRSVVVSVRLDGTDERVLAPGGHGATPPTDAASSTRGARRRASGTCGRTGPTSAN